MTDVKRLLARATPLPWKVILPGDKGWKGRRAFRCVSFSTKRDEDYTTSPLLPADAALIVYAVNSLPAYEAVVEALEGFMDWYAHMNDMDVPPPELVGEAREALRRLREEVPA